MQQRWLVTLQDLSAGGRQWDADVPQALLADESVGDVAPLRDLLADMHWQVRLQRAGALFRLIGSWQGVMRRQCCRCNAQFDWQMQGDTAWAFQLGERLSGTDDDASECEYLAAPGEINLIDILREDVWLSWQADVLCSAACKGLCQSCGADLNRETCHCRADESDHPFAALRNLRIE